jgi:hypothetical protein
VTRKNGFTRWPRNQAAHAASITSANACLCWLAHTIPPLGEGARSTVDVINRLRSFYKKGAPPERAMVDVNDIIQEMTVLLRNEAVRYAIMIALDLELGADVPNILADRMHCNRCSWCS